MSRLTGPIEIGSAAARGLLLAVELSRSCPAVYRPNAELHIVVGVGGSSLVRRVVVVVIVVQYTAQSCI